MIANTRVCHPLLKPDPEQIAVLSMAPHHSKDPKGMPNPLLRAIIHEAKSRKTAVYDKNCAQNILVGLMSCTLTNSVVYAIRITYLRYVPIPSYTKQE